MFIFKLDEYINFKMFCLVYFSLTILLFLILMISWYKIFTKAGNKGYKAFIPFYNFWTLFEIGDVKGSYSLFILIPIFGIIIFIVYYYKALVEIVRRFEKERIIATLCIFFPIFIYPYLAFSSCNYEIKPKIKKTSILDVTLEGVNLDKEFSYGYEKEDTIKMKPIKKKTSKKKTVKKK